MNTDELKEFIIQERISAYCKAHARDNDEEVTKHAKWIDRLMKISPELANDFEKYMDWLAMQNGKENEGIYLFGLRDGISLANDIFNFKKE